MPEAAPIQLWRWSGSFSDDPVPIEAADPGAAQGSVAVCGLGTTPSVELLDAARRRFQRDPRIVSVSVAESALAASGAPNGPWPDSSAGEAQAAAPAGAAVVFNASSFDLVGSPWPGGSLDEDSIADWARSANHRGLRHIWLSMGAEAPRAVQSRGLAPSAADVAEAADELTALGALAQRIRGGRPMVVAVDAEWLGPYETGAQVALTNWLGALVSHPGIHEVRLLRLPGHRLPGYAEASLNHPKVRIVQGHGPDDRADLFWRPNQPIVGSVSHGDRDHGRRLVVTVLDLIAFDNLKYHVSDEAWREYRSATRRYLREVDGVSTISGDVREHVLTEVPGLEPNRVHVTRLGVEHLEGQEPPSSVPDELRALADDPRPFLLVLGNDYAHKNRDFAIRIWQAVAQDAEVNLVLAGLHVGMGANADEESHLLREPPANGSRAHELGAASPDAKNWLLAHASAVLYATSGEGFGFVPFEAATFGVPSSFTAFGPLSENLGPDSGPPDWSLEAHVEAVRSILQSGELRSRHIEMVRERGKSLSWAAAADALVGVFHETLGRPPQPTLTVPWSYECPICQKVEGT